MRSCEVHGCYSKTLPISVDILYLESTDGRRMAGETSVRDRCRRPVGLRWIYILCRSGLRSAGAIQDRLLCADCRIRTASALGEIPEAASQTPCRSNTRGSTQWTLCAYFARRVEWQRHPDPLLIHFGDTDTSFYYDHCLECYVMYTRLYNQEHRWIGRAETEDFWNWQPVQPLIWPNLNSSISEDIYTKCPVHLSRPAGIPPDVSDVLRALYAAFPHPHVFEP